MTELILSNAPEDKATIRKLLGREQVKLKILIRSLIHSNDVSTVIGARLLVWYIAEQIGQAAEVESVDETGDDITGDAWVTYSLSKVSDRDAVAGLIEGWLPALDEWSDDDGLAIVELIEEAEQWARPRMYKSTRFAGLRDAYKDEIDQSP